MDSTRRVVESWLYGWMNGGQDKDGWGVVGLSAGNGCNCIYFVRRPFFACSAEGLFCRRRPFAPLSFHGGESDLDYIAGDNALGSNALVVFLQKFKAPLVDAIDSLASSEQRRLGNSAFESREDDIAQWLLEKVAVESVPLLRVGAAEGRREFRLPATEYGFAVRGIPVAERVQPLHGGSGNLAV